MSDLDDLNARLAELERRAIVADHLATYAYALDFGQLAMVAEHYAADAHLDVINFFPGTGQNLAFDSRDAIREFYSDYIDLPAVVRGGHHVCNALSRPGADGEIEFSAYFLTANTATSASQGGQYRGALVREGDRWVYARLSITSWKRADFEGVVKGAVPLSELDEALHPLPVIGRG